MELLEGESLGHRAMRERVPLGDALRYADELLDVLAAAHAEGIVHRDVKPDNLFITRAGPLKVLDFGIARMLEGSTRSQRTAAGLAMGTPHYMPPEQVMGSKVDARADLYAVGVTLFRLAAGRHPHEGHAEMDLLVKVATEPAPPLCSVAPHAPAALGLVVDRALSLHPDDRYPDARTMQGDVQALRRGDAPPFASTRSGARPAGSGHPATNSAGFAAGATFAARAAPTFHEGRAMGGAPTQAPLAHAATGIAPSQAPLAHAATGIAPSQAPLAHAATGIAPSQAPLAHAATGVAWAQAAASRPTHEATLKTERWAPVGAPPLVPLGSRAGVSGALRGRQRKPLLVALGALSLLGLLLIVGLGWLFGGGDSASAPPDPLVPSPMPTGEEVAPPGAGGGTSGARPPAVGATATTPPRGGPPPGGKPPGGKPPGGKERERELDQERKRQREREKEGRKK
jgi:serine/threonine-protein kinase